MESLNMSQDYQELKASANSGCSRTQEVNLEVNNNLNPLYSLCQTSRWLSSLIKDKSLESATAFSVSDNIRDFEGLLRHDGFKKFVYGLLVEISTATWGLAGLDSSDPKFGVRYAQITGRIEGLMSVIDLANTIEEEWENKNERTDTRN